MPGTELVVGNTCRPHDCYDNNLVFGIDLSNKQIWGLRQGRGQSPKAKQFIGSPDLEMQKFLLQTLAKEFPVEVAQECSCRPTLQLKRCRRRLRRRRRVRAADETRRRAYSGGDDRRVGDRRRLDRLGALR